MTTQFVLTPCPPRKHCKVCEARLFQGERDPARKAAKYRHQAEQYGRATVQLMLMGEIALAVAAAIRAGSYANLSTARVK